MKINCPICHLQIHDTSKEDVRRVAECTNQCLRLYYRHDNKTVLGYTIRFNLEGKDYVLSSRQQNVKGFEDNYTTLRVYGKNREGTGYGYNAIASMEKFFTPEEVFPNPRRLAERLLNLKAFS